MRIDARGIGCPKPVLMAEDELSRMEDGTLEVLVDNEASAINLTRFAEKNGLFTETCKEGNDWLVKIIKGYSCMTEKQKAEVESREAEGAGSAEKRLFLVISTDTMGKEEELGRVLMKGFFETMKTTGELPHTIFFLNAGVKLTTINEDTISVLKKIEGMGVEIFSCGTCLKYYGLEPELKVGYRGTTNHIVEGLSEFEKVAWI